MTGQSELVTQLIRVTAWYETIGWACSGPSPHDLRHIRRIRGLRSTRTSGYYRVSLPELRR